MHKLFNQLMRNYEHATTKDDKRQYKRIRKKLIKGIIRASKNGKRYFMLPNVNSSSAVKEYLLAKNLMHMMHVIHKIHTQFSH